jgi:hypothetical protein
MRKALLPAALVALLGLIVDARPLSAQYYQVAPPFGTAPAPMAPAPMTQPSPEVRARTTRIRTPKVRKTRTRSASTATRPRNSEHKRRHVVRLPPNQLETAEKDGYKRLSDLVNFPKFFPGLGIVLVKPDMMPLGPYLCFDRNDRMIATLYMASTKDIDDHKSFEAPGFGGNFDHVSVYFNPGHPGMDMPHYHIVIWHVSKEEEARAAH